MESGARNNVQHGFLNRLRADDVPVTIFLVNGARLQGVVAAFDNFCLILRREGRSQLVYKHAISTVVPARPVRLSESPGGDDGKAE